MASSTFTAGQSYTITFIGDSNLKVELPVTRRTAKSIWTIVRGEEKRLKIHSYDGREYVMPYGSHSMAATAYADAPYVDPNARFEAELEAVELEEIAPEVEPTANEVTNALIWNPTINGNFFANEILIWAKEKGFVFIHSVTQAGWTEKGVAYFFPEAAPVAELEAVDTGLTEEEIEWFDAYFASDVPARTDAAEMGIYFDESTEVTEEQIAYIETREVSAADVAFIFTGEKGEGCRITGGNIAEAKAMIAGAEGNVAPAILEVPTPTGGNIFEGAEIISRYTLAQGIEDGFLADVSEVAKEAGIVYPVAITSALSYDIGNPPPSQSHQCYNGRLWDVLYMFALRARNVQGQTFNYEIVMHTGRKTRYIIKAHIGGGDNGEPVITLMKPNED